MNVYVDSSVLLRIILRESGRLKEWTRIERAVSSELIRVECLRTIDRARLRCGLDDQEVADRRAAVLEVLNGFAILPVRTHLLDRAADPFPTAVGTLDAIHLSSAVQLRLTWPTLLFATHDIQLGIAARAVGFKVLGT